MEIDYTKEIRRGLRHEAITLEFLLRLVYSILYKGQPIPISVITLLIVNPSSQPIFSVSMPRASKENDGDSPSAATSNGENDALRLGPRRKA